MWMTTGVSFDAPEETPGLPDYHGDSRVGGLTPSLTFDSRDSIFTPSSGTYLEGGASFYGKWLGGDADFQSAYVVAMQYVSIHRKLVLGVRGDANFSFGRQPFYMRPYIDMRGVPAMQYQGEHAAKLEAELRWQFWKRFSLVGSSARIAWIDLDRFSRQRTVTAGRTGFRYELAMSTAAGRRRGVRQTGRRSTCSSAAPGCGLMPRAASSPCPRGCPPHGWRRNRSLPSRTQIERTSGSYSFGGTRSPLDGSGGKTSRTE
jgi:hypothetical protein